MIRAAATGLAVLALSASAATAAEITILDGKTSPESLTVTRDGRIMTSSFAGATVHVLRKGAATAETFVDLRGDGGGFVLGVLADERTNTLWACHVTPAPNGRRSNLRAFDLKTGAQKLKWDLPGETSNCNDFSVGPDKALYIADTGGKLYRLRRGSQTPELLLEGPALNGVDGITFLDRVLYVNNIFQGKVYRIPLDRAGKAGTPVEITLDAPLGRPDGMRSAKGKLFVAEGGAGKVSMLTLKGDTAHVTVLKDGLQQPTAVEPARGTLWFNEVKTGKVWSIPMPK